LTASLDGLDRVQRTMSRGVASRPREPSRRANSTGPARGRDTTRDSKESTSAVLLRLALFSRVVTLALMLAHDAVFRDLSTSAHLQRYACTWSADADSGGHVRGGADAGMHSYIERLESNIASLTPWDSVYFVRIAQCGYESDQIFAFFPLLPAVMWVGGKVARGLYMGFLLLVYLVREETWADEVRIKMELFAGKTDWLSRTIITTTPTITSVERIGMVITGLVVNMVAFCAAAVVLYRLGVRVLRDERVAYLAVVVFCFNPASVFYSAVYSESLFGLFTWMGLWRVLTGRYWGGVGWLSLAGLTRSNGILGVWFLVWTELISGRRTQMSTSSWSVVRSVVRVVLGSVIVFLPYVCMQAYGWVVFCGFGGGQGDEIDQIRGRAPEWCDATVPSIYGYIQNTYWDVGFLNFYQKLVRLPFVVQSIPVIALAVATCWTWTFGPWAIAGVACGGRTAALKRFFSMGRYELDVVVSKRVASALKHSAAIVEPLVAPFVYHLALMTFFAIFVMHVNVATRFLSSSPALFWGAAQWMLNDDSKMRRWRIMFVWCASYLVVGTIMFPNFYPWV
jgi:phosphatidylinositol glycan class V